MSNSITLSYNSFLSRTRFLSANVIGIIPSISIPAFLKILDNCRMYSFSANITCALTVNDDARLPTGSDTTFPLSKTI